MSIAFTDVSEVQQQIKNTEQCIFSAMNKKKPIKVIAQNTTDGFCSAYQIGLCAEQFGADIEFYFSVGENPLAEKHIDDNKQYILLSGGNIGQLNLSDDTIIIGNSRSQQKIAKFAISEMVYEVLKNISNIDKLRSMEIMTGIAAISDHSGNLDNNPYSRNSIKRMVVDIISSTDQNTDQFIRQLITESGEIKALAVAQSISERLNNLLENTPIQSVKDIKEVFQSNQSTGGENTMKTNEVTLDEMRIKVQEAEARTVEQPEATKQIEDMARLVLRAITNQKPTTIFTDYDADGICAAYQLDSLAHTLNPDINLEVICNDRREAYGVPKFVEPKPDMQYIIFDTGCNELDYIFSTFGENTLVIDHHIIDNPDYREQFNSKPNLLNPHSISENDAENAQYCATGLSYRICEEIIKTIEETISRGNDTLSEVIDVLKSHDGNMEQFENKCREKGILVSQEHITTGEWKEQPVLVSNTAICDKETGEVLFSVGLAQNRETGKMLSEFGDVYLPFGRTAPTYITEKGEIHSPITEKLKNTNVIMAGIGTVADVVNILDEHSHNRAIVKNALAAIDNADENNTNYVIGYMLAKNGIGEEQALAKKIAFNIAPFINSAGRLSEVIGENGAQRMYNALTSDPSKPSTYQEIDALVELNGERKSLKMNLTKSESYLNTVDAYRCGGEAEDKKIAVCILPDNTPSAFCGLVASDLTGAIDKPAIVLVYNTEKGYYTGSARNTERGQSLKGFVDFAVSQPEAAELNINYGGHNDAIGISHLNNPSLFKTVIELYQDYFDSSAKEQTLLKISHSDLSKPETLEKVLALEPLGAGNKLPKFIVEGEELERNRNFIKNNPRWKDISIEDNGKRVKIRDWCYSAAAYPQAEGSQNLKFLASADLSDYHGLHIEAKAEYSHTLIKERYKTIEREHKNKLNNISKE